MELRVLEYFLTVAREGNITKAAEALHITQPTLSRQLMQLEKELDVTLFRRGKREIVLTEEGLLLRRRAEEMTSLAQKTRQDLARQGRELSGSVAIGMGELRTSQLLARLIAGFQKQHPAVFFDIYSGNSDNIKERIENGLVDVGLLLEPVDISKYRFLRTDVKEEWGVFVAENSKLAQKEALRPRDLAGVPLIMSRRGSLKGELMNWFGSYGKKVRVIAGGNLHYNLSVLASTGMGAYIGNLLEPGYPGLRYIPLSPKLEFSTVLVWKQAQGFSPAVSAFISYLEKCLKGMDADTQ